MEKKRLRFQKTGNIAFISHLDLMHTFSRAFSRAGLALKYSEGFNPRPVMSSPFPLSVGQESLCEILDITLKNEIPDDKIKEMLSSKLPEGIKITAVYDQTIKSSLAKWIGVQFRLKYKQVPAECENRIRALFDREEIVISKRSKSGVLSDTDIKGNALFKSFEISEDSCLLNTYLSASEPTVNPVAVISAFEKYDPELVPDYYTVTRTELYDRDLNIFR